MGGRVEVKSKLNEGSEFKIILKTHSVFTRVETKFDTNIQHRFSGKIYKSDKEIRKNAFKFVSCNKAG